MKLDKIEISKEELLKNNDFIVALAEAVAYNNREYFKGHWEGTTYDEFEKRLKATQGEFVDELLEDIKKDRKHIINETINNKISEIVKDGLRGKLKVLFKDVELPF